MGIRPLKGRTSRRYVMEVALEAGPHMAEVLEVAKKGEK